MISSAARFGLFTIVMLVTQPAAASQRYSAGVPDAGQSLAQKADAIALPIEAPAAGSDLPAADFASRADARLAASYEEFAHSNDVPAPADGAVISGLGYAGPPAASRSGEPAPAVLLDVREPATWVMMLAGIALIGLRMRRRPRAALRRATLRTSGGLGGRTVRHIAA